MNSFLNKKFKNDGYYCISIALVAISCIVFLLARLPIFNDKFRIFVIRCLMLDRYTIAEYKYFWTFLTYPFLETSIWSLLLNSVFLLWCGGSLEKTLGSKEFIVFYLFCVLFSGIVGFLFSFLFPAPIFGFYPVSFFLLFVFAYFNPHSYVLFMFVIPLKPSSIVILGLALQIIFLAVQFSYLALMDLVMSIVGIISAILYMKIRLKLRLSGFFKSMLTFR